MKGVDARAIANALLDIADSRAMALSNMQVQKLVYLCHGWHHVACKAPLVCNDFEAWENGPVVRSLYDALRQYGNSKVEGRALWYDALQNKWALASADLSQRSTDLIEKVFDRYGGMTAFSLSEMTHERGSPWYEIWYSVAGIGNFGMKIPDQLTREYFDGLSRGKGAELLS